MATESNLRQSSGGTRTFRGRTLEEILPQIRAELGPDAIILREREGLVGGVGGFFAQRFVEVDARRGEGQSIDIYDDAPEDNLRGLPNSTSDEPETDERKALLPPEPVDLGSHEQPAVQEPLDFLARRQAPLQEPLERQQPKPFVPRSVQVDRRPPESPEPEAPAASKRRFETDVFMERLRQASAVLPDDDLDDEATTPAAAALKPVERPEPEAPPQPDARPHPDAPELPGQEAQPGQTTMPEQETQPQERPQRAPRPRPAAKPRPDRKPRPERPKPPARPARRKPAAEPERQPPTEPQAQQPPVETQTPTPTPAPAPAAETPATEAPTANRFENVRLRPRSLSARLPTGEPRPTAPTTGESETSQLPATVPVTGKALQISPRTRREELRETFMRLLRFRQSSVPRTPPAQPIDPVAATELANDLSARGASQAWTTQLIRAAGAHGSPLAGSLRAATEAEVARRIVPAPALPVTGAAVAFIGAGGAGKTRCTAALASAYRRGSTLGVIVIAVDNPEGARELRRLLADDGVPVLSLSGEKARKAVEEARQGGFVIVDTPTATPTDDDAVDALGALLEPLELDATYVALPATLGPQAARRALASFGKLRPSAVAITHTDETDQLAVVVEIAISHRIPLAYFHSGTDHHSALSAISAPTLAQQLLTS